MYKCAIIGVSGSRAQGHAEAYRHVTRGRLVAVSARHEAAAKSFAAKFNVPAEGVFTDYRKMFAEVQPDLVHVNTPPSVRAEIVHAAAEFGIPALIVEKPVAIDADDWNVLWLLAATCPVKVAVNHQLHYHAPRVKLMQRVAAGDIGPVRFIDASAAMNPATQGTHILQSIFAFNPGATATRVLAQVSGSKSLAPSPRMHVCPDNALAEIVFDNGVRAHFRVGDGAPRVVNDQPIWAHKRITVYGDRGDVSWTMWGWSSLIDGKLESGSHDYRVEDEPAQAAMTEAMFDWIADGNQVHPLNLADSLTQMHVLLAMYQSAMEHREVQLPCELSGCLIEQMRRRLVK